MNSTNLYFVLFKLKDNDKIDFSMKYIYLGIVPLCL